MDRSASNLTGTGVDFVVATTQASINSSMLEYLAEGTQPVMYLCFLAGQQGNPTVQVTLEELMAKTENINPFDIPQDLDYKDPRIRPITKARFVAGIKLQMGLPPGANPKDLSVVNFEGTNPNKVTFTMYCAQATVIHNIPGGFDGPTWNVWSQTAEEPWIARAEVDLVVADLDTNLENSPYLKGRHEVKEQLKKALVNLSGSAFSLQQLLFDLDNATMQENFKFTGIDPTSDAGFLVDRYFVSMYQQSAREHGLPLLAITAVSQDPDPSSLQMTSFERTLTHPIGSSGPATTLNYLCAINDHPPPSPSTTFGWNWVDPAKVDESSGVIAIQRNAFIRFLEDSVQKQADSLCYRPWVDTSSIDLLRPTESMRQSKSTTADALFDLSYKAEDNGKFEPYHNGFKSQVSLEVLATVKITFEGRQMKVVQWLQVYIDCAHTIGHEQPDGSWVDVPDPASSTHYNAVFKTLTSLYSLAVDERGALQLVREGDNQVDQSDEIPSWTSDPNWQVNYDTMRKLQEQVVFRGVDLHEMKLGNMHNFIFPGARVFTYKDPCFSKTGDLLCEIIYLDPTEVSSNPQAQPEPPSQPQASSPSLSLTPSSGKLTVSTELIQNYVHGEIVSPRGKFEALQTGNGHTLLFAIDSSGVFHVIEEQSGTSHTGWHVHDLSTEPIQVHFPGDASRAVVRTFDVGQNVEDGTIGMMMAVHLDGNDHLFLSLGNSKQDLSWTTRPLWTMAPFDPVNETPQKITIAGAMFAETQEKQTKGKKLKKQYLIVDINRLSESSIVSEPHIARYQIDPERTTGYYWVKHDVTIDLAAGSYQSVVGRIHNKTVDGIYTAGTAGGQPQLIYEPIVNEFGSGPVNPRRLKLPRGASPSAITTARHPTDGSTDLYSIGGSTLYWFASDQQSEAIEPVILCTSDFLAGTDTLRAMTSRDGVTTLWGRNQSDQVYYLSCPTSQVSVPTAWSAPFPILSGVERISAYVNCADGGNTIFAAGNGKVQKVIQGSAATGKVWRAQEITLAAAPEQPCTSFLSYTTTIHVTQLTSNAPIPKAIVELSANSRAPVYINGVYYVLSTDTPLRVLADQTGTLTVIEATDSLQGTVLTVSLENTNITINPMDHSMDRIAALDSAEKLRSARVPRHTVAGGIDDSTTYIPLLDPSTNEEDMEALTQSFGLLKEAYVKIQSPKTTLYQDHGGAVLATASLLHATTTKTLNLNFLGDLWHGADVIIGDITKILGSIGGAIISWGGDALQWLKNTTMVGLKLIKDTLTGGLHLLGNWAGKTWHVALNTWHTVVEFGEWLWDQGKKFVRKAKDWATVLLHWGDIRRTKQVTHNLIRLWMQHQVDQIPHVAAGWNQAITGLEQTINQWAGTTDFAPLGTDGEVLRKPAVQGAANPNEGQTSASNLLLSHYRNHAHQLQVVGDSPALTGVESLLFDLLGAVSKEGRVLSDLFAQLKLLVQDFASLSLEDVLKRMMGILSDFVLSSVQGVVDTLLQVLHTLTQSTLAVLDTKIHIPIISDLLNTVGITDISFLDLFTWIIAVAFTIVYKITHSTHAPFPDNSSVSALIAANTWEEISRQFGKSTGSFASFTLAPNYSSKLATEGESSSEWSGVLFAPGHFLAGLAGFVLGSVTVFDAESETEENPFSIPAMILGIISAGMQGITNHFAPRDEIENKVVVSCEYALITIEVLVKVFFSGTAQGGLTKLGNKSASVGKLVVSNARGLEAIVDAVLILPGIAIMCWHIYELSKKPAGKVKSAAILEECGKVSAWIARVAYAVAVNDPEPESKEVAAGVTGLAIWAAAGFQIGEAEWC